MYVRSFFGVSAGASLCERKSTSDFPNPPASRPVSSESKKTNARTNVRAFVFWCVRRGFALRKKIDKRFSEPSGFSPCFVGKQKNKRPYQCTCVRFLVCPPGLEPGPGASEALMVSNSTTGTIFRLFTNSIYNSFCLPKPFFIFLYLFYSFLLSFCKRLWYNIFKFLKIFFFRPFFGAFCPFFRQFSPRFPFFQRGATSKILFREYLLCKKR